MAVILGGFKDCDKSGPQNGRGNKACIESMEVESSKWHSQLPLALCKSCLLHS